MLYGARKSLECPVGMEKADMEKEANGKMFWIRGYVRREKCEKIEILIGDYRGRVA